MPGAGAGEDRGEVAGEKAQGEEPGEAGGDGAESVEPPAVGAALVGDRVYGTGSRLRLPSGQVHDVGQVALFAAWVVLDGVLDVRVGASPGERKLRDLWTTLGGDAGAWDIAVSCVLGRPSS